MEPWNTHPKTITLYVYLGGTLLGSVDFFLKFLTTHCEVPMTSVKETGETGSSQGLGTD